MRALAVLVALVLASCATPRVELTPTPSPTREPGTTAVTVLLDLSGSRAPRGVAQRDAMQLWLDQDQARGGPTRLRVKFVDLAGSDARLLIELRRAAVEDNADAVVIGVPFAYDETFAQALAVAGIPVLLTLPAPEPTTLPGGGWAFALAPTYADLAQAAVTDAAGRGALRPVLLASDESAPAIAERLALAKELAQLGLVAPTVVPVTASDAAARLRPAASLAQEAFLTGPAATYLDAARAFAAAGLTPRVYLSYLMESSDAAALGEGAELAMWPGSRNVAAAIALPPTTERATFLSVYASRYGPASTLAATAYDALALIDALAAGGGDTADRSRLRERLAATTFAGIATRYTFNPSRHAGFDLADLAFLRWSAGPRPRTGFVLAPEPAPRNER